MVPLNFFAEVKNREAAKHDQRDDFLDDFQLRGGVTKSKPAFVPSASVLFKTIPLSINMGKAGFIFHLAAFFLAMYFTPSSPSKSSSCVHNVAS